MVLQRLVEPVGLNDSNYHRIGGLENIVISFDARPGELSLWKVDGVKIIDVDGKYIDENGILTDSDLDYFEILNEREHHEFMDIDYSSIKDNIRSIIELDGVEKPENGNDVFVLLLDNAPGVKFSGKLMARVGSEGTTMAGDWYSGRPGFSEDFYIYKSVRDDLVCYKKKELRFNGIRSYSKLRVCHSQKEVMEFFGENWLADELYYKIKDWN